MNQFRWRFAREVFLAVIAVAIVARPSCAQTDQTDDGSPVRRLKLSSNWKSQFPADQFTTEFGMFLIDHAKPVLDLTGGEQPITLFNDITYLMPLAKAEAKLGNHASALTKMLCQVFPKDSFSYSTYNGAFNYPVSGQCRCGTANYIHEIGMNYDRLLVITDAAKQVIAIELIDDTPKGGRSLPYGCYNNNYHVFDFVLMEGKESDQTTGHAVMTIGHTVLSAPERPSVLMFYGEMGMKYDRLHENHALHINMYKIKKRVLLLLPVPLANVISYNLANFKK